jgi:RNA polymerase sigma-70 factor (ECF subfamily)
MSEVERDDGSLVDAARRGDEDAFARLYAAHQPPIYRYALHMCGAAAADDIVQDTFLALLRRTNRFDPARGSLLGYLCGIARHYMLKCLASSRIESPLDDEGAGGVRFPANAATAFDDLSRMETVETVRAAIQSLPLVYREVVVLCELQELDYAVAAAIIERPVGTVRSRLHRARALLMSKLASAQPAHDNAALPPSRFAFRRASPKLARNACERRWERAALRRRT